MSKIKPSTHSNSEPVSKAGDATFARRVLRWFDQHGRKDLPWQKDINAYRVWVSEIMLQQTQVATVIGYYENFMARFPDVATLADAPQDDVLHYWSGLGYYSRARNLHKTAQLVVENFNGEFPDTVAELETLPGIGRSTAGAIAAIAFQQHCAILDGNVKRVLARHFAVEGWPGQPAVATVLWDYADAHTPKKRVADYTQAMMDLGATLCTRSRPDCTICPIRKSCKAYAKDSVALYPGKKPKKKIPVKTTDMHIVVNEQGHVLLQKRPPTGIWASLWSIPEDAAPLAAFKIDEQQRWPVMRHTFSHFHLDITPIQYRGSSKRAVMEPDQWLWYNLDKPAKVGLAAPVSKILKKLVANRR